MTGRGTRRALAGSLPRLGREFGDVTSGGGLSGPAGLHHGGPVGITALEVDADRLITQVTSVYDSRQLSLARRSRAGGCVNSAVKPNPHIAPIYPGGTPAGARGARFCAEA